MNTIRRIYRWIIISVFFQVALLSYINFVYLPGNRDVKATMIETDQDTEKSRSLEMPYGAKNVKVSFDGKYAAYMYNGNAVIADIKKKVNIKELEPDKGEFSCFEWIPDREMLIYAQKNIDGYSGRVQLSTYDIGADLDRSYPVIKKLPKGSEIIEIEPSPLTNIVYPIIKTNDNEVQVYKFDIMDELNYVMSVNIATTFKETLYTDNLIYQQPGKKINVLNGETMKKKKLPVSEPDLLLDVDDNDNIYAAQTDENGEVIIIYSGKLDQDSSDWNIIKLESPCEPEDIFITSMGKIFLADRLNSTIYCVDNDIDTAFSGELVDVLDDYVVTMDDNNLILQALDCCK